MFSEPWVKYKNLLFFNKNGEPLNFVYKDGIWEGTLHFPEVSVGLYENQTIYVVEKQKYGSQTVYGEPVYMGDVTPNFLWYATTDEDVKQFGLYEIAGNGVEPTVQKIFTKTISVTDGNIPSGYDISDGLTTVPTLNNSAIIANIWFCSNEENEFESTFYFKDTFGEVIAKINLYGEAIGEDERFNVLLGNFGEHISHSEEFIFKTSDINEALPDYKLLNRKRKEFLIEHHNLVPYFSSYKGILNTLKFFDYYDIKLKEYWFNPENSKYLARDVEIENYGKLSALPDIPQAPYQKTCNFGLFYSINEETGEFDEFGLPITKKSNIYSQQEVLIKLYGLKNYIYSRNIGGVSKILDIIGQASYFTKYKMNTWTDKNQTLSIQHQIHPKFTISNSSSNIKGKVQDLRYLEQYVCTLPNALTADDNSNVRVYEFGTCWVSFFNNYQLEEPSFKDDQEDIPVGFPLELKNTTFDTPWSEATMRWVDGDNESMILTFNNFSTLQYYDIEWYVKYAEPPGSGRGFEYRKRGDIESLKEHTVVVPYDGKYNVTLILYGYNGVISTHTKKDAVLISNKAADFAAYYKIHDGKLQNFSGCKISWNETSSDWKSPINDNSKFKIGRDLITNRSMSSAAYFSLVYDYPNDVNIGYRDISWSDYNNPWSDFEFVRYADLSTVHEKPARFTINRFIADGIRSINIGGDQFVFPVGLNIHDFKSLADFLSNETSDKISNFDYVARPLDGSPAYVDCVSKSKGSYGDTMIGITDRTEDDGSQDLYYEIENAPLLFDSWNSSKNTWLELEMMWKNSSAVYLAKGYDDPYTYDNVRFFDDRFEVPIMIPVAFVYDNSKVPGKKKAKWTIIDSDTQDIVAETLSVNLIYRFTKQGFYDIKCGIYDSNDNYSEVMKQRYVSVLNCQKFRLKNL